MTVGKRLAKEFEITLRDVEREIRYIREQIRKDCLSEVKSGIGMLQHDAEMLGLDVGAELELRAEEAGSEQARYM